jgi:hypothetical protein
MAASRRPSKNGVAREMFCAVKGEGVYALIQERIRSDIIVASLVRFG